MKKLLFLILIFAATLTGKAQLPSLPDTLGSCNESFVVLDAGPGFLSYLWSTGETTQAIAVYRSGWYQVICTGDGGQIVEDSALVSVINAHIIPVGDTVMCFRDSLKICLDVDTLRYAWSTGDTTPCIWYHPDRDSAWVQVQIYDTLGFNVCQDSILIRMHTPVLKMDTVMQINTGCPGTCKGQLEVLISGGAPPYDYFWYTSPVQYDSIAFGLCEGKYHLIVRDSLRCKIDTLLNVRVFSMPEVEIMIDPDTGTYIKYPIVTFLFENKSIDSIQIIEWFWNFGDSTFSVEEAPRKVYDMARSYEVWLRYTTDNECVDSVSFTFEVKDVKLTIPNIFTPNGDGINEYFEITDLDKFMSNEILIYNRWGKKVFESNNYRGNWDGDNVPDGVYFYTLRAKGYFGEEKYRGSVTIMRR